MIYLPMHLISKKHLALKHNTIVHKVSYVYFKYMLLKNDYHLCDDLIKLINEHRVDYKEI